MVYSTQVKLVFPRNDYLRDHTFMMSTHKGDGGSWNLPLFLWICVLFPNNIPLVHFSGSGGLGVTKLVTFCGCHIYITPNPEFINSCVNFDLKYAKPKCIKISGRKYSRMDQVCFRGPYPFTFLKAVFHKIYLVHSWILFPIYGWKIYGRLVFLNL